MLSLAAPAHSGEAPDREQTLWSPYWTVEAGFTSTLEMKNNRSDRALDVQVSLYFANGEEYYLQPLQIAPRQTVVVSLNQVYESLPAALRARVGKEGSVEVQFNGANESVLMGGISVTNSDQGIAWTFRLYPRHPNLPLVPLAGVFWFYDSQSDAFVAMQNVSAEVAYVTPRLYINRTVHVLSPVRLYADQIYKLELGKELRNLGLATVQVGAIELSYEGQPEALVAHGAVFNRRGFSSEITFLRRAGSSLEYPLSLRTPRFAIGTADPRLGLPPSTVFEPVLAVSNLGEAALPVQLRVGFQAGEGHQEVGLPVVLGARESRVIRLADELEGALPPGISWASLELSYVSRESQLAGGLTSVSRDGHHSIGAVLNHVEGDVAEGWYWQVSGDWATLLGILNADAEEARIQVWLDYHSGGQAFAYDLPETLIPARGSVLLDLGEFVGSGLPDADGDVIPAGVTYGGYRVRKLAGGTNRGLTTEALLVNRRAKTYLAVYNTCCPYGPASIHPEPISGPVGSTQDVTLRATNLCSGFEEVLDATFSSNNSTVASVSGSPVGTVFLNNPGSATIFGTAFVTVTTPGCDSGGPSPQEPPFSYDEDAPLICCGCDLLPRSDSASVTVSTPQLNLSCPASVTRGQSATCTASVTNVGSGATVTFTSWRFSDGTSTVTRSCTNCPATWSGTMVKGGTVTVTARVNQTDLPAVTRTITVTNRNWHTNPASPTQVPNGVIVTLPVPPQPGVGDSGLGFFLERTGDTGASNSTIIQDDGPNHGYAYFASQLTMSPFDFRYTINPDLENSGSVFSQHQCGNYNASTNPGGFISWSNLVTHTRRHEFNHPLKSHHGQYAIALNSAENNPGDFFEARVAPPGSDLSVFAQETRNGLDTRYNRIGAAAASEVGLPAVNEDEFGTLLGNINYLPYVSCN